MRRSASLHGSKPSSACVQCVTDASSHHSNRCGIAFRCAPAVIYARICSWLSQAVIVQKVQLLSASSAPVLNPGAFLTCRNEPKVCTTNSGTKRNERILSRVRLTKIIPALLSFLESRSRTPSTKLLPSLSAWHHAFSERPQGALCARSGSQQRGRYQVLA
jgi:hypothetical protein